MNLHRRNATHAASIPSRGRRRRGPGLRARAGLAWCAVAGLPLLRARRNRGDWPLTHLSPRPPPGPLVGRDVFRGSSQPA